MKAQLIMLGLLLIGTPAAAQDIIVTASRIEQDDYQRDMPAVGLTRSADFLVQPVTIRGDTRDPALRQREINQMLLRAVQLADQHHVELAFGSYVLTRLTAENIEELGVRPDNRPDSQRIDFLVKAPLGEGGAAAQARIQRFVDAVPEVGRAQMDTDGEVSLSITNPDQYRTAIAQRVMTDATALATQMGADYRVTIEGLNMPVQWSRSGTSDVFLYVPYKLVIVPKP